MTTSTQHNLCETERVRSTTQMGHYSILSFASSVYDCMPFMGYVILMQRPTALALLGCRNQTTCLLVTSANTLLSVFHSQTSPRSWRSLPWDVPTRANVFVGW